MRIILSAFTQDTWTWDFLPAVSRRRELFAISCPTRAYREFIPVIFPERSALREKLFPAVSLFLTVGFVK